MKSFFTGAAMLAITSVTTGANAEILNYAGDVAQNEQNSTAQDLTYNGLINDFEFYQDSPSGNAQYDPNAPKNFAASFTAETGMGSARLAYACQYLVNNPSGVEMSLLNFFDEYAKMGGVPSNRITLEPKVKELIAQAVKDCGPAISFVTGMDFKL